MPSPATARERRGSAAIELAAQGARSTEAFGDGDGEGAGGRFRRCRAFLTRCRSRFTFATLRGLRDAERVLPGGGVALHRAESLDVAHELLSVLGEPVRVGDERV